MSGFETSWLDLREPVDMRARDAALLARAAANVEPGAAIVDLGCGTGSTYRALAPGLTAPARWRLVDNDPQLLAAARERVPVPFEAVQQDLADLDALPLESATLVTASALFDLCSATFVEDLGKLLAARGIGLYAALNYDGVMSWQAPHDLDAAVVASFNRHQRGDKGFGPALGPLSARFIVECCERLGFEVTSADSPWIMGEAEQPLQKQFLDGIVNAVTETGDVAPADLATWRQWRLDAAQDGVLCRVGHQDVLALRR